MRVLVVSMVRDQQDEGGRKLGKEKSGSNQEEVPEETDAYVEE